MDQGDGHRAVLRPAPDFGDSEAGRLLAAVDWDANPLGPPAGWPDALVTATGILLDSAYPMVVAWGPEMVFLYNDGYRPVLGDRHPEAMGRPFQEIWSDIWDTVGPIADRAMRGEGTYWEDLAMMTDRYGYPEKVYFTFSYFPLRNGDGTVGGMMCACTETTGRVVGTRRLSTLSALSARSGEARTRPEACRAAALALESGDEDIPGAAIYLADGDSLELAARTRPRPGRPEPPAFCTPDGLRAAGWHTLALGRGPGAGAEGVLAVRLPDWEGGDGHRDFLRLVAEQVSGLVAAAGLIESERRRADALAELDRAKTDFFGNVSHEFRTPLALLLGPVTDALREVEVAPPEAQRERLAIAERNARRLERLVNSLLDLARLEDGRAEPHREPVDLAQTTADIASVFRGPAESVGLRFEVSCPPLGGPVLVDRDMWEKIVLNLVSNALKFTWEGGISVSLACDGGCGELRVRDTGVGIAPEDLPDLFTRFHRVRGARSRTHEGTGIGLALVRELARAHGGDASVTSAPGEGTEVRVRIPLVGAHEAAAPVVPAVAEAFAGEVARWMPTRAPAPTAAPTAAMRARRLGPEGARIVLVDDNADMRDYLTRLLDDAWRVTAFRDGAEAAEAVRRDPPDLVLADVMMPGLDGFALLEVLRADPRTRGVPVVLLSARAGEEAVLEGLAAGADDYMVKPFSAQELVTRIGAHLELSAMRAELVRLHESARIASLVAAMQEGVASLAGDGTVVWASDRLGRMAGAAPDGLVGHAPPVALPERWDWPAVVARAVAGERVEIDATVRSPDGAARPVLVTAAAVPDDPDADAVMTVTDLSDRMAAQRATDEFVSLASHELRTPLTSLLGFLDMAARSSDPAARERYVAIARRNAGRLERLTKDILDLTRNDSGRLSLAFGPVDLAALLADCVADVEPGARERGQSVALHLGALPAMEGDDARLRQVVGNLLSNAVKFTPDGGRVEVAAHGDGGEVTVEVRDTGAGIGDDDLPHVFDRFFRSREATLQAIPGSGLGLAVARMIVEGHGGRIGASRRDGGGTCIRVVIPTRAAKPAAAVSETVVP